MTPRQRYRQLVVLSLAHGIRPNTATAQVGEPGRHAYALQEAATMRHKAWLNSPSPRYRRMALEWWQVWMREAKLAREEVTP